MRTTARSLEALVPISCPCSALPLERTTWILCSPLTTWLLVTISPCASIITPEPICSPCAVVTLSSTTAGSTFAIAASICVCNDVLLDDVADAVAEACDAVLVLLLPLVSSQPANKPTPKIKASTSVRSTIAPARPGRFRGGGGATWGSEGYLGGPNASCSGGACGVSNTPTGADDPG